MKQDQAAQRASDAADDAVRGATIAKNEAERVASARKEIDERFPSDHELMVRALASEEQAALLRVGPRRNRWRDLAEFEDKLAGLEQRRAALSEEIAALNLKLHDEPTRHTAALAAWLENGETGERPGSRVPELEQAIQDRQAEYDAAGLQYNKLLRERAEHVAGNRGRFQRDIRKAKAKAADEYAELVDRLEATRRGLLDLRATEVWVGLFPSEALTNEPNTEALAGAVKRVQEPLIPVSRLD